MNGYDHAKQSLFRWLFREKARLRQRPHRPARRRGGTTRPAARRTVVAREDPDPHIAGAPPGAVANVAARKEAR